MRFVWSVNPNLYEPRRAGCGTCGRYWPGSRYVDVVGSTMINFGGLKAYTVGALRAAAACAPRGTFRKPVVLTETNTAYAGRLRWLRTSGAMLAAMPWITAVAWSQLPSRGKVHLAGVGRVDWDVEHDPPSAAMLRAIIRDGER